jgi:hypothetical protein
MVMPMPPMSFACMSPFGRQAEVKNQCFFAGIGSCQDFVSSVICNSHSKLFNITNERLALTTGSGLQRSVVAPFMWDRSLSMPLFLSESGNIILPDLINYVDNICQRYPTLQKHRQDLITKITCLLEPRPLQMDSQWNVGMPMHGYEQGWISRPESALALYKESRIQVFLRKIPLLFQILLFNAEPSHVLTESGNMQVKIPTVGLMCDGLSGEVRLGHLMPDPLVLTRDLNSYAVPIVVGAVTRNSRHAENRMMRQYGN